ncbi:MAG: cytidylate kinase family protein [Candidatus Bathyarchaeota archaeon]|nr:cytidylate kinase family protein [Candidatus Bathyarchaeota archaeon]MDH5532434.1 cytidylate kinase family protein [Candidatus Bathyarchaeota archaeon]MDH5713499.1 cytidylate kinase family protein [Candidatus Bathyarchaeota archaeon]
MAQKGQKQRGIVICVAGMSGCGKSTAAKRLATRYGLRYFSGGDMLKALAVETGYKPCGRGWWETEEGRSFLQQRSKDHRFDKRVDEELMNWARRGNVVLDSWTMPWLLKEGAFKVWLEVSTDERARRLARRDRISVEEARRVLEVKDGETRGIFKRLYGFGLGADFSPFDLILDANLLESGEVFRALCMVVDRVVLGKC